jgi:spore germination protein KB
MINEGIEVIANVTTIFFPLLIIFISGQIILLIPKMNINHIRPILYVNEIIPLLKASYATLVFPFIEVIILTVVLSNFNTKKSPYKVYLLSLLFGGIIVFTVSIMNLLVLGEDGVTTAYFPSYASAGKIDVGKILQRGEIIPGSVMVIGGLIKASLGLLASCKGFAKSFGCKDYRFIVTPVSLLLINLTYFEFEGVIEYGEWVATIYHYYAFLFVVILPIIILIATEIKKKRLTNN